MGETLRCINHPTVETYLRCNRCGQPICARCAVQTPVGYRCRQCVNRQQRVFFADFRPVHYLIAGIITLPLALVASLLIPALGWYTIILGPLAGAGIAELVHLAVRRRRSPYLWLVVSGIIVVAALPKLLFSLLLLLGGGIVPESIAAYFTSGLCSGRLFGWLWDAIYVFTAASTAGALLRPGRRV
ncbi:MAG: B-box zinc finger protein [Anaerolineae bacterium]|nr:B-box zinc finger protein [Anaerolineae bacterium]